MSVLTIGLADAKNNFSRLTTQVNDMGKPVTVLKNNRPWVVISPAEGTKNSTEEIVDIAVDLMDEYAEVFKKLAQ
ncbi:MAG: type II toxin-antitoxin system Phd/YefM family antitoxin [Actinomycetaceae bacterium]|nr:type II toxin-antitoxin system Phd/YefM family antitoxin [Actinomycetaceae bacterium]